jgi:AGZA family xanthine/uracil permease-like MFS transporter
MQPREIHNATFLNEVRAGITTFATMAYIIAVNVRKYRPRHGPPSFFLVLIKH